MNNDKIRIFIANEDAEFSEKLELVINTNSSFSIVGKANSGNQVLEFLSVNEVDVLLIDIEMQGLSGLDTAHLIRFRYGCCKIIALSNKAESEILLELIDAGFLGYINKQFIENEIIETINAVANGQTFFRENSRHETLNQIVNQKNEIQKQLTCEFNLKCNQFRFN